MCILVCVCGGGGGGEVRTSVCVGIAYLCGGAYYCVCVWGGEGGAC